MRSSSEEEDHLKLPPLWELAAPKNLVKPIHCSKQYLDLSRTFAEQFCERIHVPGFRRHLLFP